MKWPKTPIEAIASVKGGKRLPKGHDFASAPTDHPYIRARDIGDNRITFTEPVYITDHTFNKIKNYTVNEGDIVVTIVGANIGDVGFITDDLEGANLTENAARIRVNKTLCDPRFLSFQLSMSRTKESFQLLTGGSAQGKLGLYKINAFDVVLPPLPIQRRIAATLSAYDDLIENNRRRIALLERAARLLYREWFVALRFPDHEHTSMGAGVPEGWEKKTAYDVMEILSGGTPSTQNPDYWDGDIPFYTPKDYTNSPYVFNTERSITERGLAKCNSRLYPKNTVFISARGTVGKLIMPQRPMAMSQTSYALIGKDNIPQFFLFCVLQSNLQHFLQQATGAVFSAIVVDTFRAIPFVVPTQSLIDKFEEFVAPMFSQIEALLLSNEKLRRARDLLLPRLMNGELTV